MAACREGPGYLYGLVFVALTAGIRKSALLSLKWPDLDFGRRQLTVRKTKGGCERRVVLAEQTVEVLKGMSRRSEYVFTSRTGGRLKDIRTPFKNACKRAKIEGMVFHTLRHCFASMLAEQGVDAISIMNCLGHKGISMSLIYTHLSDGRLRQAVNLLPELRGERPASESEEEGGRVGKSSHLVHIG
ncbi:site-specific integrase [bacterium]|nr:site-specific integrase [bacterium]